MTRIIDGVEVLTYDEWKILPEVVEMYDKLDDCRECGGTGEHDCSCGDEHECYECKGSGKIKSLSDIYRDTLQIEIKKLTDWNAGKPILAV